MTSENSNPVRTGSSRRHSRVVVGIVAVVVALGVAAGAIHQGFLWPNRWFAASYDVRGVDVSHYQGTIDWPTLAAQDVDFAYIKATEGSGHTDERFAANWEGSLDAGLLTGAYHFMSFESSGADQARNMIEVVPATPGTLPPVVDLEPYGEFMRNLPPSDDVRAILDPLLADLEAHYGVPPVIYTTSDAYDRYLAGAYPDNPIWIRSVLVPARLPDGRDWALWQYSHRDRLDGSGSDAERFTDMNVFSGSRQELEDMTVG